MDLPVLSFNMSYICFFQVKVYILKYPQMIRESKDHPSCLNSRQLLTCNSI